MYPSTGGDAAMRRAHFSGAVAGSYSGAAAGSRLIDKLLRSASTDFCPGANRYLYWLKEPIGWFVMALVISVLIGVHVTPLGWTLASVIGSIIVVGMLWPWVAVRMVYAGLRPAVDEVHEGQTCDLILTIRNALPLPLWGLVIEGYLDCESDEVQPTTALACVPGLSQADYRLAVCPTLRGHYPILKPKIACAFPFGIWTARRTTDHCSPLTVLPQVFAIQDDVELHGGQRADWGDGQKSGTCGDRLGVREFRGGDRLRNVHWVQTARTGNLMVCERSRPEQQSVEVHVDLNPVESLNDRTAICNRDAVAWRIRAAASLLAYLNTRRFPVVLHLGSMSVVNATGPSGFHKAMLALAEVPAEGVRDVATVSSDGSHSSTDFCMPQRPKGRDCTRMQITSSGDGRTVFIEVIHSGHGRRHGTDDQGQAAARIDLHNDVASQMKRFWREMERARLAA